MAIPTLSAAPPAPQRITDTPAGFVTKAEAFVLYIEGLSGELNPWASAVAATVSGVDFNGASATSLAIGTGSKTFTASTGKLWNAGQYVIAASSANVANYMVGQVTAYNSGTGQLVVNVTSYGGTGTRADWVISLAPAPGDFITAAGSATLTNKTVSLAGNTFTGTTAQFNAALSDGDFATLAGSETLTNKTFNLASNTLLGTIAQFNAALTDGDFATLAGSETLTNKTLASPIINGAAISSPVLTGTLRHDHYVIPDGAGFAIDPTNGDLQQVTLGANRTPSVANFGNGDVVDLLVDDGAGYTIDWTAIGISWINGSAPTLKASGYTRIQIWRMGGSYYGMDMAPTPTTASSGISYVGGTTAGGSLSFSTGTVTVSLTSLTGGSGSAPVLNDVVVVSLGASSSSAGSDLTLSMNSAGWTQDQDLFANSTYDANLGLFYKRMGATPDTSFTLNLPAASGHSYAITVQVFRGVDTVTALDGATTTGTGTTTLLVNPPAAPAPASGANCLVICGAAAHLTSGTLSASYLTNFLTTTRTNTSGAVSLGQGYIKNIVSAYDGAPWTFSGSDNTTYSHAVACLLLRAA